MLFNDHRKDLMNRALDGDIDAAEHAELTNRLDTSPADAALWDRMLEVDRQLRQAPMVSPPSDFAARVMVEIHALQAPKRAGGVWLAWRLAAVAVGGVSILMVLRLALLELLGPMPPLDELASQIGDLLNGAVDVLEWLVEFAARYPILPATLLALIPLAFAVVWLAVYYTPKGYLRRGARF